MRLSPVLIAALSAAATLGLSSHVHGQTLPSSLTSDATAQAQPNSGDRLWQEASYSSDSISAPESSLFPDGVELAPISTGALQLAQTPQTPPVLEPQIEPEDPDTSIELEEFDEEPEVEIEAEPEPEVEVDPEPAEDEIEIQLQDTLEDEPEVEVDPEVDDQVDPEVDNQDDLEPGAQPPVTPPTQTPPAPGAAQPEPRVLVAEVDVASPTGAVAAELEDEVYRVIRTQPGRTTTRSQLQEDINAIFSTGFFSNVQAVPQDTPLGVRVTFLVQPNPVLRSVQVEGNQVLPPEVVDEAFADQYGEILNLRDLQQGIQTVNEWYQENGYVLAQVTDAPQISEDGTVTLVVAEGVIEDINVRFIDADTGQPVDEEGEPVDGRTRPFIITREFETQPGDVFNQRQIEQDLQRVFGLGIFEDVRLSLEPGTDPRQVDIVVNVTEGQTGSLAAGVGFSTTGDLFGTVSYQEQNLGGNNQKLGAEFQISPRELLFDVSFTDPWIAGDPFRTSYTVNAFNRRSISLIFDGGETEVRLPADEDGDRARPRIDRLGGGVTFTRPSFGNGWTASLGAQYQRVTIRDSDGDVAPVDELGNDLSLSGRGRDDLWTLRLGAARDLRNDRFQPTSGSVIRLSSEQAFPLGLGGAFYNRLQGSYSYYVPVDILNLFTDEGPEALAFNVQGGTILGDFPPYEAFSLGGSNSVRGYDEGDLGTGQSFLQATVEYRFPILSFVGGALFADFATDLGTANSVIGNPADVRGKPGSGFGFGAGVRIQSPLGPIRVDYGINDQGNSRIHFGIGERF